MPAERIEQGIRSKISEKRLSIGEKVEKPFIALGAAIFVRLVEHNIVKPIKPEYPEGFDNAFMELAKNPDVLLILISNHTGHADVAGTAVVSKQLTELANRVRPPENQFRGFMLTIAASLESAHQNLFLQQCTRQARKLLSKYSLSLEAYIRKKDIEKYQMHSRNNAGYAERTNEIIRKEKEREADGLVYYIEGTVEGGRRIKEGENAGQIKGTQRIDWEQCDMLINRAQSRDNRNVVIITISSDGASEILDPDQGNRPTRKTILTITGPIPPEKSLLTVKVSMPRFYDDLKRQIEKEGDRQATLQDIGDEIGREISSGLPPEKRGYYK